MLYCTAKRECDPNQIVVGIAKEKTLGILQTQTETWKRMSTPLRVWCRLTYLLSLSLL